MFNRTAKVAFLLIFLGIILFPRVSLGQICIEGEEGVVPCGRSCDVESTPGDETAPCTLCHLIVGIKALIDFGMKILVYAAILVIVIAGIFYIVSTGNTEMMAKAKKTLWNVLTGFALVLGAWLIVNVVLVWLLPTREDFGIERTSWSDIECSTKSSVVLPE